MKKLLVSIFGLGYFPFAPGTWGSLPPAIIFGLIVYFCASAGLTAAAMAVLAMLGSLICIKLGPYAISTTGQNDPKEMTADEFAGQALTFFVICIINPYMVSKGQAWAIAGMGFLLFRMFDILKPWPIKKIEKLPTGWGILADDLAAGVYAGLLFFLINLAGSSIVKPPVSEELSLNALKATLLGLVQGLTEFLPVSSSGHLVLLEKLFGFKVEGTEMLQFDLVLHLGTVSAILIVFRKPVLKFLKNLAELGKHKDNLISIYKKDVAFHILILALVATAVTGIVGIIFKKCFTEARSSLELVTLMWITTGALLLSTDLRKNTKTGLRQFGLLMAMIIGLAQAAAILPGISRSGATICTAILLGLRRRWAVEFSFLIAIPAIVGANAVELFQNLHEINSSTIPLASIITGFLVSIAAGIIALKILIKTALRGKLRIFAFYCFILSIFVIIYCLK